MEVSSTTSAQILYCQYDDCEYGNRAVNPNVANMAFCSNECHLQVMVRRFSSAGVILVSPDDLGAPIITMGSDRNRRNKASIHDPTTYGIEIFGGSRDKDIDSRDTAIRELREESGIDIDPIGLRKYLTHTPVIVKPFTNKGIKTYYVVFIINITGICPNNMKQAWQSRVLNGSSYASTEMDLCYQMKYIDGVWKDIQEKDPEKDPITLCKYHVPVINKAVTNGYLVAALKYLPSVNSIGIWQKDRYILK
jgi:hypothetical protein